MKIEDLADQLDGPLFTVYVYGFGEQFLSPDEAKAYKENPVEWWTSFMGCTKEELEAYLEYEEKCLVTCHGKTKRGNPCGNYVLSSQIDTESFLMWYRDIKNRFCHIHKLKG